jgi:hypothetical protein
MGDGEIIGNLSVHWSIAHDDGQPLRVKQNETRRPTGNDPHNVATGTKAQGRDPKSVDYFDVMLRFESKADATTQLQSALAAVANAQADSSFFINFRVPATVNGVPRQSPDSGPRPDVGIKW